MKLYRRILAAAVMLGLCAALAACSTVLDVTVSVMVEAGEGYRVLSENPVTVRAGEDAVFTVEVEDGYTYVSGSGAVADSIKSILSAYSPILSFVSVKIMRTAEGGRQQAMEPGVSRALKKARMSIIPSRITMVLPFTRVVKSFLMGFA